MNKAKTLKEKLLAEAFAYYGDPEKPRMCIDVDDVLSVLSALKEDPEVVERVAKGLYAHNKGAVLWEEKHKIIKDEWRSVARAALSAIEVPHE